MILTALPQSTNISQCIGTAIFKSIKGIEILLKVKIEFFRLAFIIRRISGKNPTIIIIEYLNKYA